MIPRLTMIFVTMVFVRRPYSLLTTSNSDHGYIYKEIIGEVGIYPRPQHDTVSNTKVYKMFL